jgi:hypothetical protein
MWCAEGATEAIRALMVAKRTARAEWSQTINQAGLILTGSHALRPVLLHSRVDLAAELRVLRPRPSEVVGYAARVALCKLWPAQPTSAVLMIEWWNLRAQDSFWAAVASPTAGRRPLAGIEKVLLGVRRWPHRHEAGLPMPQNGDLRRISNDHTTSTSQNFLPAQD